MKRRGFLKAAVVALFAPLVLVKTAKVEPVVEALPEGEAIDWVLKYAKDPRLSIVTRTMDKMNKGAVDDLFADEYKVVDERTAKLPQPDTSKLKDLYVSPEAMDDFRREYKDEDIEKCVVPVDVLTEDFQ